MGSPDDRPDDRNVDEWLSDRGIRFVDCCFVDMWGILGGRRLPVAQFRSAREGLSMPVAPLVWRLGGEIEPTAAANPENGFPNVLFVPDVASLRRDPDPAAAVCIMDAWTADRTSPSAYDTRGHLRRQVHELAALGWSV